MFSFKKLINSQNRPLVMGILNVTPDSFSDGGEAFSEENVLWKLSELCDAGADIIDVGACSTAPGNRIISETEELKRLKMFLPLVMKNTDVPVSLDTFRPGVAEYALSMGVSIINDESGIFDIRMAEVVKKYGAGWIFMHTGGEGSSSFAEYPDGVVDSVRCFFSDMKKQAVEYGLSEKQLCYDFGIGFGKTRQDDVTLLTSCEAFGEFSPLLVGVSRKRVIGEITQVEESAKRVIGSVVAGVLCAYKGAEVLRVHDVQETLEALKVTEVIKRGIL